MIKYCLFFISILCLNVAFAQEKLSSLGPQLFFELLKENHPLLQQQNVELKIKEKEINLATAYFDPTINLSKGEKEFIGQQYYSYQQGQLKIPTLFGVDFQMGVNDIYGTRNNPETTVGTSQFAGVSFPLLQSFIIDKRRAYIKQAKNLRTLTKFEQEVILNDFFLEAMNTYWDWVYSVWDYKNLLNSVALAERRIDMINQNVLLGEQAPIDTLDAISQLQLLQQKLQESELLKKKNTIALSAFLFTNNLEALWLSFDCEPEIKDSFWNNIIEYIPNSVFLENELSGAHPALKYYDTKKIILDIQRKLKFQELFPKLNLEYNLLSKTSSQLFLMPSNNYQYGIKFELPIRLTQGRSEYAISKLKIQELYWDRYAKQIKLEVKLNQSIIQFNSYKKQEQLLKEAYDNVLKLSKAEWEKFINGESTMFLVNSRDNKAIETYSKLIKTRIFVYKSYYFIKWCTGEALK